MLGRLPDVEPFVEVAERRSFRRAAEHLGVSPAAVSQNVARLEDAVGVRLLDRTTRRVAPTPEGERFLVHCRAALDALRSGRDVLAEASQVPDGELRLSTTPAVGPLLRRVIAKLGARHPRLTLSLSFSDRKVDLIADEVDVALRVGALPDSSLRARRLGGSHHIVVGSPSYLGQVGTPQRLSDLASHRCLGFVGPSGGDAPWFFQGDRRVQPAMALRMDDGQQLVDASIAGLGLVQCLDFMVREPLADGRLVQVLTDRVAEGPPVHAVWLQGRARRPAVRAFLDAIVDAFTSGSASEGASAARGSLAAGRSG